MGKLDELWNKVSFGTQKDVIIAVLEDEIEIHKSRLQPSGSGSIHTTIGGIEQRIKELKQ
jgi:hypothetical protein